MRLSSASSIESGNVGEGSFISSSSEGMLVESVSELVVETEPVVTIVVDPKPKVVEIFRKVVDTIVVEAALVDSGALVEESAYDVSGP